jgi:hypothetical protein
MAIGGCSARARGSRASMIGLPQLRLRVQRRTRQIAQVCSIFNRPVVGGDTPQAIERWKRLRKRGGGRIAFA